MAVYKNWALNCLRHNRNSALLNLASLALLNSSAVESLEGRMVILRGDEVIFNALEADRHGNRLEIPLDQVVAEYRSNPDQYMHTLGEYLRWGRRALLKESFEIAKAYAREASLVPVFRALPSHTFARFIRNSVSHDLHFNFRKDVLAVLPVGYGGVTLEAALQGQPMLVSHLSPWLAFTIHNELEHFVMQN